MKKNLSRTRFYLSSLVFYTCLLTFPLSATLDSSDKWMGIDQTASKEQEEEKGQQDDINNKWLAFAKQGDQHGIDNLRKQYQIKANQVKDEHGNNALHLTCIHSGSVEMTKWFLDVCKIGLETKGQYQMTPFLFAALKGQLEIAKLLKRRGANINEKTANGSNALHWACDSSGSIEMVTWLLDECKIGLETRGHAQMTSFLFAARRGNLSIAKLLSQRGANLHAKSGRGNNALHYACHLSGSVPMVTWLLDVCKIDIETKGHAQMTPFLFAALKGQLEIAKLLKRRGANINEKTANGSNALHWACDSSGSIEMVTWLLDECKIGLETRGHAQMTSFLFAARRGNLSIAKLLSQRGANLHAKSGRGNNALHYACHLSGSVPMVTWLLDVCKIDIETKGHAQMTPFLFAALKGQLEIAKLLKRRGANIHAKSDVGGNALHYASYSSGSIEMVTWLLHDCKIDSEAKGEYEMTPFLCAAQEGQLEIAKLLKERGANIDATDEYGNNALHFASRHSGSAPMVTWLLDVCHIGIEVKGKNQKTAFLYAAEREQLGIAKLLKQRGANINAKDEDGNNALDLAPSENVNMTNWFSDVCKLEKKTWVNELSNWITSFIG